MALCFLINGIVHSMVAHLVMLKFAKSNQTRRGGKNRFQSSSEVLFSHWGLCSVLAAALPAVIHHSLVSSATGVQTDEPQSSWIHEKTSKVFPFPSAGTYVTQVTATDADDPTYGNSARVVYSILHGQPYFSVDPKTGERTTGSFALYGLFTCVHLTDQL